MAKRDSAGDDLEVHLTWPRPSVPVALASGPAGPDGVGTAPNSDALDRLADRLDTLAAEVRQLSRRVAGLDATGAGSAGGLDQAAVEAIAAAVARRLQPDGADQRAGDLAPKPRSARRAPARRGDIPDTP